MSRSHFVSGVLASGQAALGGSQGQVALTARAFPLGVWTHTPRDGEELLQRVPHNRTDLNPEAGRRGRGHAEARERSRLRPAARIAHGTRCLLRAAWLGSHWLLQG